MSIVNKIIYKIEILSNLLVIVYFVNIVNNACIIIWKVGLDSKPYVSLEFDSVLIFILYSSVVWILLILQWNDERKRLVKFIVIIVAILLAVFATGLITDSIGIIKVDYC